MKIIHRLSFNKNEEIESYLNGIGIKLEITESKLARLVQCYIDDSDGRWFEIQNKIKNKDISHIEGLEYSKEDFDNSSWFQINVSESVYPQPEGNLGYREATYNLEKYCPSCGIGLIQNKPFRLKADIKTKNYKLLGLHWAFDAIFIRPEAKEMFEKNSISGVTYSHPLLDKSEKPISNLYQLEIKTILPKGYIPTEDEQVTCKLNNEEYERTLKNTGLVPKQGNTFCYRIKFLYPRTHMMTFDKKIFNNVPDFVKTNEWFGSGFSSVQVNLVSEKVYNLVTSMKWRGIVFKPIELR